MSRARFSVPTSLSARAPLPAPLLGLPPGRSAGLGIALALGSAASLWCSLATAQQGEYSDRPSVKVGDSDLYPSLRIGYERNNNAFLTPDDETSANDLRITPEVLWRADQRTVLLEGRYRGDYRTSSEGALDRTDHLLGLSANAVLGTRQRVEGGLSFLQGSEDVGTELTRGDGTDFDKPAVFNELNADGSFTYGADGARGNFEFGLRLTDFDYDALRRLSDDVDVTDGRGYSLVEPFGVFSLRLSEDTRALLGLEVGQYSYENDAQDRQDLTVYTGLNFSATGALSGNLQLGSTTASFDNIDRDDQTTFSARIGVVYSPVDYSSVTLTFNREFDNRTSEGFVDENTGQQTDEGDVLTVEDLLRLDWNYDWSSRFYHNAFFQLTQRDRECPEIDDDVLSAGLELNLMVRRWVEVGVGFTTGSRSGDAKDCGDAVDEQAVDNLDYDRQVIGAHVRFTL